MPVAGPRAWPDGGHDVVSRPMRRPGLRAAAGAGRLQHELPLAGVGLAGASWMP